MGTLHGYALEHTKFDKDDDPDDILHDLLNDTWIEHRHWNSVPTQRDYDYNIDGYIIMHPIKSVLTKAKRTVVKAYRKRVKSGKEVIVKTHKRTTKRTVKRIPRKEMRWF